MCVDRSITDQDNLITRAHDDSGILSDRGKRDDRAVEQHQTLIADLCQTYGVQKLEVFGSAATGAFDSERSDIVLIVDFADESPGLARRFVAFAEALEACWDGESIYWSKTVQESLLPFERE